MVFNLPNSILPKVKATRYQYSIGLAIGHSIFKVFQITHAARRDYRCIDLFFGLKWLKNITNTVAITAILIPQ